MYALSENILLKKGSFGYYANIIIDKIYWHVCSNGGDWVLSCGKFKLLRSHLSSTFLLYTDKGLLGEITYDKKECVHDILIDLIKQGNELYNKVKGA